MSEWQNKKDCEINKAVAELEGLGIDHGYGFTDDDGNLVCYNAVSLPGDSPRYVVVRVVNYCNNPSDSHPIILKSGIDTLSPSTNGTEDWFAGYFDPHSIAGAEDIKVYDKNPLRAAMIVYLEMNGVKP